MPRSLAALTVRNYRIWALAGLVSVTGTWMQLIAQNWLVLELTGSGAALGLCVTLQALPNVVAGLWGGALADRLPTRWVLRRTQSAYALLAALLAALTATGAVRVGHVFVFAFASGCVAVLDGPAGGRFGAEVVGREHLANAIALGSASNSAGRVLGMALAGVVVAAAGPGAAFAANAVSFLAVVGALALVRESEIEPLERAAGDEAGVGAVLRALRHDRRLQTILGLAFVCGSFGRNYQVTMALMNDAVFRGGPAGYGFLSTLFAVGALVGAFVAARTGRFALRTVLTVAALGAGLEVLAGLAPGSAAFAAVILPIAVAAVVLDTAVSAVVQLGTPEALRGRILALVGLTGAAAGAVGAPVLGLLSSAGGPRSALVLGGLVVAAAVGIAYRREVPRQAGVEMPMPPLVSAP